MPLNQSHTQTLKEAIAKKHFVFLKGFADVSDFTWYEYVKILLTNHSVYELEWDDLNNRVDVVGLEKSQLPEFARQTISYLEDTCYKNKATLVGFTGFENNQSFKIHRDMEDVFYLQVFGKSRLSIYKTDLEDQNIEPHQGTLVWSQDLECGDAAWIPRSVYHHIQPDGTRLGFSFGVEGDIDPSTYVS